MSKVCSCGATIEFVKVGRKKIPCDPSAAVYRVSRSVDGSDDLVGERQTTLQEVPMIGRVFWVTHFATCPDAGAYSQAKSDRLEVLVNIIEAVDIVLATLRIGESMPREMNKAMLLLTMARERL